MRLSHRLGVAIAVAATGIFAIAAPAVAGAGQRATAVPGGTQVWVQRFGGAHLSASATSVAASPDKAVVYVTGITAKTLTGLRNEVTVAYNAATGKQLWLARYQGVVHHPRGFTGIPSITVSPDGATVYVAGDLGETSSFNDYLMLAYDAATGALRWAVTPVSFSFAAQFKAVAVSPDSTTVYMTGRRDFSGATHPRATTRSPWTPPPGPPSGTPTPSSRRTCSTL